MVRVHQRSRNLPAQDGDTYSHLHEPNLLVDERPEPVDRVEDSFEVHPGVAGWW